MTRTTIEPVLSIIATPYSNQLYTTILFFHRWDRLKDLYS